MRNETVDLGLPQEIKRAAIAAASSGDNTLVAAVTGKRIRVIFMDLLASDAVNARFESAAGGTALTGLHYLAANGGWVWPYNPAGWIETLAGQLLNLELSGAVAVGGVLGYVEV